MCITLKTKNTILVTSVIFLQLDLMCHLTCNNPLVKKLKKMYYIASYKWIIKSFAVAWIIQNTCHKEKVQIKCIIGTNQQINTFNLAFY